jgi:osmotically-inducible protein OsmY
MRTDNDIQKDITQELKWDPRLQDDDLAVGGRDGIVTLAGYTRSYTDKVTAERVVGRVKDVRAIANDIEVRLPSIWLRPDPEIARAALNALKWHTSVPDDRIQVRVDHGKVMLEGDVDWYYQKDNYYLRKMALAVSVDLSKDAQASAQGLQSADLGFTVTVADFDQPVTVEAPANAKPFQDLMNAVLGSGGLQL